MRHTLLLGILITTASQAQTIGLTAHLPGNLNGYVLFAPTSYTTTYLIDKCGRSVHTWNSTYRPGLAVYMLDDGSLLRTGTMGNMTFGAGGRGGIIERIAWDGSILWSYQINNATQCSHHDIHPMPNGHVLVIAWEIHTAAEAIAEGRDPALVGTVLWGEKVMELEPVGTNQANIVWEWHGWDHLVQQYDNTRFNYGVPSEHPELVDFNYVDTTTFTSQADWIHLNAIDYNVALDQIILGSHSLSEMWIIDHSTTTAEAAAHVGGTQGHGGDLLYRYGNPQTYGRGGPADQVFFGQHNPQWIGAGLPDAGKVLVFNNGLGRPGPHYSELGIFTPPADNTGQYSIDVVLPYGPSTLDYTWTAPTPTDFYGSYISGAQMLPDSGFMVCNGATGTFFELDGSGAEVWRYVCPVNTYGPMTQGAPPMANTVFRCTWIAPDAPGLAGHDLTPGAPIELQPIANACATQSVGELFGAARTIMISPVPTSDRIHVSDLAAPCTIDLLDPRGANVKSWLVERNEVDLDLSAIPAGIYTLRAQNAEQRSVGRVVLVR